MEVPFIEPVNSSYYEKLYELRCHLHELAVCRVRQERLDDLGVPDGSVIFSTYKKSHICTDGSISEYTYTNAYLYIDKTKYYIASKVDRKGSLGDVNDPRNQKGNIILRGRLELRMKIRVTEKQHRENARVLCGILNSSRPRGFENIDLQSAIEAEYLSLVNSDQYMPLRIRTDNELAEVDIESMSGSRPDYTNDISLDENERLRSKNELITALCLKESGFSYVSEPRYPGMGYYYADFRLNLGSSHSDYVYIEIAGMMESAEYREKLNIKRKIASEHGIKLIIIDMTDYIDENGRRQTRLHYAKLKKIFFDIQLGRLKCNGEIVKAY